MRLYTFEIGGEARVGAELPGQGRLIDLHAAEPALPSQLLGLIRAGKPAWRQAAGLLNATSAPAYAFQEVRLLTPIARPGKILCSGINYRSHQEENPNAVFPEEPFFFAKMPSAVIGPGVPILHPKRTSQLVGHLSNLLPLVGPRAAPAHGTTGVGASSRPAHDGATARAGDEKARRPPTQRAWAAGSNRPPFVLTA